MVKFSVNPVGFDKVTSVAPCVPFLMKMVTDDEDGTGKKKPFFNTVVEDEVMKFHVATLGSQVVFKWSQCPTPGSAGSRSI